MSDLIAELKSYITELKHIRDQLEDLADQEDSTSWDVRETLNEMSPEERAEAEKLLTEANLDPDDFIL